MMITGRGVLTAMAVFVVISIASAVTVRKEISDGNLDRVWMENDLVSVEIDAMGGKVTSFHDCRTKKEFAANKGLTSDGFLKQRDWVTRNDELLTERHKLVLLEESPNRVAVLAEYEAVTGNFQGLMFRKTYVLEDNAVSLKVKQEAVSVKEENAFMLNINNMMNMDGFPSDSSYFYARSTDGLVGFSVSEGMASKNNIIYNIAEPWMGLVDREAGNGIVFIMRDRVELDNLFFWVGGETCTVEWTYGGRTLAPRAEMDAWETEYSIVPIKGLKSVCGVASDLICSIDQAGDAATLVMYPAVTLGGADVVIRHKKRELARQHVSLLAGEPAGVKFNKPSARGVEEIEVSVESADRQIVCAMPMAVGVEMEYARPAHKVIKPEPDASEQVEGFCYHFDDFNVSPDITVPVSFAVRGDFSKKRDFRLVLEAPEGIEFKSEWPDDVVTSDVELDGKQYTRYEFSRASVRTRCLGIMLFVSCGITNPVDGLSLHYYAKWRGGGQPKRTVPVNIVRVPRAPALKRIFIGMELAARRQVMNYPDIAATFNRIGLNYLGGGIIGWGLWMDGYKGRGALLDLIEPMQKAGITVSTGNLVYPFGVRSRVWTDKYGSYKIAGTLYYPNGAFVEGGEFKDFDVEETKAVNIAGEKTNQLCPSCRGRYYKKVLDNVRILIDYGYTRLLYDEETWGKGRDICYCPRCISRFEEFLRTNHPELKYVDPREAMAASDSHPALCDAWRDFKFMLVQEIYQGMKDTAVEHGGSAMEIWAYVCAYVDESGVREDRLTSYSRLALPLDAMLPMLYTRNFRDNKRVGDIGAILRKQAAGNARPMAALSPARSYEFERVPKQDFPPAVSIKYQILESVAAGISGFTIWAPASSLEGALSYKHLADAVRIIAPIEDIVIDGAPIEDLAASNRSVHVRGMAHEGRAIILVAEYSRDRVSTHVTYEAGGMKKVVDLETGETVGEITSEHNSFEVVLDAERARLFLIE